MVQIEIANRKTGGLWWKAPIALVLWVLLATPIVAGYIGYSTVQEYTEDLPRAPDLDRWLATVPRTSRLVAADGTLLAEIPFSDGDESGHRYPVELSRLPLHLVQAILAAEDVRFLRHRGVDGQAIVRAAWANYRAERIVEGASTITQQLARNLLPEGIGSEQSLRRKVREAALAYRLERRYSKTQLLETYANLVFLGAGAHGVAAAARSFFDKDIRDIDLAEAALIAGQIQSPSKTDPYNNPDGARQRRDEVLRRMERATFISAEQRISAAATPIALSKPAVVYGTIAPWHTEKARKRIEADLGDIYRRGGLVIETTAAPALSRAAEILVGAHVKKWSGAKHGAPQAGALLWDYRSGYVEATVGGTSWDESRFDRATQACRQPGSAFKPIVYTAALEANAITPGTALRDAPIAEYDPKLNVHWKPKNSGRAFRGVALAQDALASSLNAPAVDVLDRVGSKAVLEVAARLGLTTKIDEVRPLALGSSCTIPLELASAFAVIANRGTRVEPIFVSRVRRDIVLTDRAAAFDPMLSAGRRLDRLAATVGSAGERVIDEPSAFMMSNMLRDVVRRGTGTLARSMRWPAAGKTGTTNENTDAWFVGYTGRVIGAVWLGYDDPAKRMGSGADGGKAALPLWKKLVSQSEIGREPLAVPGEAPDGLERARIDRETGMRAEPGAGGSVELYFRKGTAPSATAGRPSGVPASMGRTTREF